MAPKRRHLVGTVLALAIALLLARASHAPAQAAEEGVTYEGAVNGGTVRITLVENLGAVSRAEVHDASFGYPGLPGSVTVTRTLYYVNPIPFVDAQFQLYLPVNLFGSLSSSVRLRGELDDNGDLTGDATYCSEACYPDLVSPWTATETDVPPAPTDVRYQGAIDTGGTITLTLDAQNHVTSFDVDAFQAGPCYTSTTPVTTHTFYDPATDAPNVLILTPYAGWRSLGTTVDASYPSILTGVLNSAGVPYGDCPTTSNWTATPQSAAVGGLTRLSQQSAVLPANGDGLPWPLLAIAVLALGTIAFVTFRRGAR